MANASTAIKRMIYEIRGQKVMLDRDLAELYGVELKRLNEATKRNIKRFPRDFMFQLKQKEWNILRSQIATANGLTQDKGNNLRSQIATANYIAKVRFLPYVFTEHGVLMLSNVLNSTKAVNMSIQIIRVFDKLRKYALEQTSKEMRIEELHNLLMLHIGNTDYKFSEHDKTIKQIVHALNKLIEQPKPTKKIGFNTD